MSVSTPGAYRATRIGARCLLAFVVLLQAYAIAVPASRNALTAICLIVLQLVGGIFAVRAARGGDRTAWLLVALGQLLTLLANPLLAMAAETGGETVFWLGSACGLGMYAAFALAALMFPARRLRGWQRAGLVGETVAILGCGFMYTWYFVLRPHLDTDPSRWPLTIGFPLGDLVVLIGISTVVLRGGLNASTRPLTLLMAGLSIFLVSDAFLSAVGDDGNHASGPLPATLATVTGSFCTALAALWQNAVVGTPGESGTFLRRPFSAAWFSYLPYVAVGLGLTLMVVVTVREDAIGTWGGQVLGLTVVTAGLALRQVVTLQESRRHETVDPLTGLTNRVGLNRRLTGALRRGEPVALLLIDLDGFKAVNDTHGHNVGDLLLIEFASVLTGNLRRSDTAARIGGDEFVVLQHGVTGPEDVVALGRRILAAAADSPIRIGENTLTARASIGAALAADGDTAEDLRHRADVAMYHAKRTGAHELLLHRPDMLDRRADDEALGRDLVDAVESGQLRVLYQPMVNLDDERPAGVEALVRWQHPVRGLVSPLDFIPVAERTGAITGVGLYVLEQACRDLLAWNRDELYASVNLSARQLQDPTLVADVLAILRRTGLSPGRLVLEITESAIVDDRIAIPAIEALRSHGIRIAIDDFGTGYSSLQYLSRLPVDILKIDRSFVAELDGSGQGTAITEAVVRLAEILDLTTVAEGIETREQVADLRRLGCRVGQGYLYAKPLPAEDAAQFLTSRTAGTRTAGTPTTGTPSAGAAARS